MLVSLQKYLNDVYQTDCDLDFSDYLITDKAIADCVARQSLSAGVEETVLVAEDENGIALSVYLDRALLSRLECQDPLHELKAHQLGDLSIVLEGISHFNYLAWSAGHDRSVTLLELELQAEVDKFVAATLLALDQQDYEFARQLHCWLFEEIRFHPSLDSDERERYETANDYAGRFCHRMVDRIAGESGLRELRDFYRLSQADKMGHIHSLAWGRH